MRISLALLGLALGLSLGVGATDNSEPSVRPAVAKLLKKKRYQTDEYEFPYLFSQTAIAVPQNFKSAETSLLELLYKGKVNVATPFTLDANLPTWNKGLLTLPSELLNEKERAGLEKCTLDYCFPKLNDRSEKPYLMKATDKPEAFRHLISQRVENFLKTRALLGYDDRNNNHDDSVMLLRQAPFLKSDYPEIFRYLQTGFWKTLPPPKPTPTSFLRTRMLVLDQENGPKRLEPVYWIGEVVLFREKTRTLAVEFPIYSNHYFDSWIRIYEVVSLPPLAGTTQSRAGIILTDVLEIDELKKSALIRMLFKGKMVDGVQKVQLDELASLN